MNNFYLITTPSNFFLIKTDSFQEAEILARKKFEEGFYISPVHSFQIKYIHRLLLRSNKVKKRLLFNLYDYLFFLGLLLSVFTLMRGHLILSLMFLPIPIMLLIIDHRIRTANE